MSKRNEADRKHTEYILSKVVRISTLEYLLMNSGLNWITQRIKRHKPYHRICLSIEGRLYDANIPLQLILTGSGLYMIV